MKFLSKDQALKEAKSRDPDSVKELTLSQRALCDISYLSEFRNLEKLDLRFNGLLSLDGLKSCFNLKWLSVVQNKLQSLKGIEGLEKLTVLNAGKNKLKSMDEVKSLVSLRALILNDNEISSICKLDQLKELNTLVLSRNPIKEIGDTLSKSKNLLKVSLSNCLLKDIGSSLRWCTELKELRLAHNEFQALPSELAYNKKLQTLDLGNNLIIREPDLKVLDSLRGLKNLNIQGNPVAENEKLIKKVRNMLQTLQILNAKPIDKVGRKRKSENDDMLVVNPGCERKDNRGRNDEESKMGPKYPSSTRIEDDVNKHNRKQKKEISAKNHGSDADQKRRKGKRLEHDDKNHDGRVNGEKNGKLKRKELGEGQSSQNEGSDTVKNSKIAMSREDEGELNAIDDAETSFISLFVADTSIPAERDVEKKISQTLQETASGPYKVSKSSKRKKNQRKEMFQFPSTTEVGMGGPSTWE